MDRQSVVILIKKKAITEVKKREEEKRSKELQGMGSHRSLCVALLTWISLGDQAGLQLKRST